MKRFLYELSESWKIAVAQMRSNKTRSTLTALGVVIGIERVLFERICATAIFQLSLSSYKKRFISKSQHRLAGDLPPASS